MFMLTFRESLKKVFGTQAPAYVWTAEKRVTYNPYKNKTFVDKSNNKIVNSAEVVHISNKVITAGQFDQKNRIAW